jgi:hypothetical protein
MKRGKTWIAALAAVLVLYLAGYAVCRGTKVLVHTANVLNLDFHGRYHMIRVADRESAPARIAGWIFLPLREIEARYHGRGGRLD